MRWSAQYERLPVYGSEYAIATSHPTASAIGLSVLERGGNAVDAALAAHAALCVVEPGMTGAGGDCFALFFDAKRQKIIGINGSGFAPGGLAPDFTIAGVESTSGHAAVVPGAVDAWCRLAEDYATKSLEELFAPAIRLAADGFIVHRRVALDWADQAPRLATHPATARLFLPGGRAPPSGERHAFPALARTLAAIAARGRSAFYEGEIAEDMVAALRAAGGAHSLDDFAACRSSYVEPISTEFAGRRIVECPPNGQGVIALLMLNVLTELLDGAAPEDEAETIDLLARVTVAAYRVRDQALADERFLAEPAASLLSRERARALAAEISAEPASRPPARAAAGGENTTYLCAVDRDGNAISFINSLFDTYGSCIVAEKSGVLFNDRALCFSPLPGHLNAIGPRKRPLHTIIPGMMTYENGGLIGPFGIMGGHYQAAAHANFALNLLIRGMDPQECLNAPRTFAYDGVLRVEPTLPEPVVAELQRRGHDIAVWPRPIGGGQAIMVDRESGVLVAASDPRKDGCALAR